MKPILFEATEKSYTTNGLGILSDAISCIITEERNGAYELEMEYPISGIHYDEIKLERILLAKSNATDALQPFRIYRITRPLSGRVRVLAQHISYDLSGVPVAPFTADSAAAAMVGLETNAAIAHDFALTTDIGSTAAFAVTEPISMRAALGGTEGSLLDVYGGELEFDRYAVILRAARGLNRGVSIRYGKNLTDLEQDENCASVYTGVYPYWRSEDTLVTLPEKILYAEGTYPRQKILTLDCYEAFEDAPSVDQLREYAQNYMTRNQIGVPKVSLTVSFVQLEQTQEYAGKALLERVNLCDTVSVDFPALGVSATAKCIKTVYNALLERYESVSLGDARTNIADTIVADRIQTAQAIEGVKKDIASALSGAQSDATDWITNGKGYVVIRKNASGQATEILVMDQPDIETATKVWRWNNGGLGYSSTGYNGPYTTAITQDGKIVADFVTVGTLTASIIKAGVLSDVNGHFTINLDTGAITIKNNEGTTVLSYTAAGGLEINGKITSTSGEIGGFTINPTEMIGGSLRLNSAGYIDVGALTIKAEQVSYPEILAYSGQLAIGADYGVYIGGTDAYALFASDRYISVNGTNISSIQCGSGSCNYSWRDIPGCTLGSDAAVVATGDGGNHILIRYNYGWQWCTSGSSSSYVSASWIGFEMY